MSYQKVIVKEQFQNKCKEISGFSKQKEQRVYIILKTFENTYLDKTYE